MISIKINNLCQKVTVRLYYLLIRAKLTFKEIKVIVNFDKYIKTTMSFKNFTIIERIKDNKKAKFLKKAHFILLLIQYQDK